MKRNFILAVGLLGVAYSAMQFGEKKVALCGLALQVLGFLGIVFAPAFWELYPISALIGAGNALMRPTLTALNSNGISLREQGRVAGVTASLTSLTYVFRPLWAGVSYDYIMRAADVTLKEKQRLVLVVRETPLHLGHLRLMTQVAEMGAVVMPPVPAFNHRPKAIDDIVNQTVDRVLDLLAVEHQDLFKRWTGPQKQD